jgi:hypothetical protein
MDSNHPTNADYAYAYANEALDKQRRNELELRELRQRVEALEQQVRVLMKPLLIKD